MIERGVSESMPARRRVTTYKFRVGGSPSTYVRVGEREDGRVGEIFITQSLLGTFSRGMIDAFAIMCSKALQYGMPFDELCDTFIGMRFEPSGFIDGDDELTYAVSLVDYIFRRLKKDYGDAGSTESLDGPESLSSSEPIAVQDSFI